MTAELFFDQAERLEGFHGSVRFRADGHGQSVKNDIFFADAVGFGTSEDFFGDCDAAFRSLWDSAVVECQRDDQTTVFFDQREDCAHGFLLAVYRVDHRFPVVGTKRGFHRGRVRGIDLQRQIDDRLQFLYGLLEHGGLINFRKTHIDI